MSGVEEGDAFIDGRPDGSYGRGFVDRTPVAAQVPGAERDPGHPQVAASERCVLHGSSLPPAMGDKAPPPRSEPTGASGIAACQEGRPGYPTGTTGLSQQKLATRWVLSGLPCRR